MDDYNHTFSKPVVYKEVKIYPVKIENIIEFYSAINCLLLEKNKIPDPAIIKMSYLDFVFMIANEDIRLINSLYDLLQLVLKEQSFDFDFKNNKIYLIVDIENKKIEINSNEFENIRKVIFKQNLIKYDEKLLSPELEKRFKEVEEFLEQKNGKSATFSELVTSYHVGIGLKYSDIEDLTIWQFYKGLERLSLKEDFEVYTYPLLKSGESEKIKHWLSHVEEKGKYDHILMDKTEFDKITKDKDIFGR
jgi:hypothetical protein